MQSSYNLQPLNSHIYSGGNISLDAQPYINYYLQSQARNKAKEEAFIKSFQDIVSSTTPSGMAANDIPDFMKKKKDWINYIIQNKDAYENPTKDNGKAYGQAMAMYNQILQHAENSKAKLKSLAPLNTILSNPDRSKRLTEQTMQNYHNGALPVDDPNYSPFDMSSVDFNDKPFEQKDLLALDNNIKTLLAPSLKNKTYSKATIDAATHSKITPYSIKLTDNDYNNIRANAALLSGTNSSFANFIDDELNNPNDYQTLNKVYQSHFPNQNISSREDMATALFLSRAAPNLTGEEKSTYTPDTYYAHRQYAINNPLPTAESNKTNWVQDMVGAVNGGNTDEINNVASQLFAGNQQYVQLKGTHVKDGNVYFDYKKNVFDANAGEKDANGKPKGAYVWKDATGVLPVNTVNNPASQAKMAAFAQQLLGTNQKLKTTPYYKQNNSSTQPDQQKTYKASNGKNYSLSDLKKAGYTDEQIQQAIKLGNLK